MMKGCTGGCVLGGASSGPRAAYCVNRDPVPNGEAQNAFLERSERTGTGGGVFVPDITDCGAGRAHEPFSVSSEDCQ